MKSYYIKLYSITSTYETKDKIWKTEYYKGINNISKINIFLILY